MSISQVNPNQLRPPDDDGLGVIVQIGPDRRAEAVAKLVAGGTRNDREHARRFIEYVRDHRISLEGLWSRLDERGAVKATVLAVPSPGRTAMVFASRAELHEDLWLVAGLIDRACECLPEWDVNLAQALLDPAEELERQAYHAAGFGDLAILSYLERPIRGPLAAAAAAAHWPAGVEPVRYRDSMRDQLIDVLERSYEETLDCPTLRGHRRTEDILEGHRASGIFDPALWTILQAQGEPCGALLLNPSSDRQTIELVYLGLAREVRGRGLGRQLLRHGLRLVESRRERTINLAVDEANAPALGLYRCEGFSASLRRRAMIRPLPGISSSR